MEMGVGRGRGAGEETGMEDEDASMGDGDGDGDGNGNGDGDGARLLDERLSSFREGLLTRAWDNLSQRNLGWTCPAFLFPVLCLYSVLLNK